MSPFKHSEETVSQVLDLWAAGMSAKKIALRFDGFTKNVVIGLIHRRYPLDRPRDSLIKPKVNTNPTRKKIRPPKAEVVMVDRAPRIRTRHAKLETLSIQVGQPIRFMDRNVETQCAWIDGPSRFVPADTIMCCGQPSVLGKSWCAAHQRLAWRAAPTRKPVPEVAATR